MRHRWTSDSTYEIGNEPAAEDPQAGLRALADKWEANGRDWHWNSASRNVWLTTAHDLRALLDAAPAGGAE